MRIVCLGNDTSDFLAKLNADTAQKNASAQKALDYFYAQGGNTPIRQTTVATKEDAGFFNRVWGFFSSLPTLAAPAPAPVKVHTVKSPQPPFLAMAGIGLAGVLLFKAVNK